MKTKSPDWVPVANGAADARDALRARVLPSVIELVRIVPEGRARTLALSIQDGVYAAVGRLTLGLKARAAVSVARPGAVASTAEPATQTEVAG